MPTHLNKSPLFGPVSSRRLGTSLGVNLMPDDGKICSFDCAYCENGLNAQRRSTSGFQTLENVIEALREKLIQLTCDNVQLDSITFAGNGEPTASPIFSQAITQTVALRNELMPQTAIAVLSNGMHVDNPEVRHALMQVDNNILKLDTVDSDFIHLIDRPGRSYDVEEQIRQFAAFNGHAIIQTMFLRGTIESVSVDNTTDFYVDPWLDALTTIKPQAVEIYTIARDTPFPSLEPVHPKELDAIAQKVHKIGFKCVVAY